MEQARQGSEQSRQTEHVCGEGRHRAGSWSSERRVIFKAEVVRQAGKGPKDNLRFVIANLKPSPQLIYEQICCERGDIESRLKELHHGLGIDPISCTSFWAVLMTAAAYVLMQELRLRTARTACARAQVWTLRERLLKLGANVVVSVRRIVLHLPQASPYLRTFHRLALSLGARTG